MNSHRPTDMPSPLCRLQFASVDGGLASWARTLLTTVSPQGCGRKLGERGLSASKGDEW